MCTERVKFECELSRCWCEARVAVFRLPTSVRTQLVCAVCELDGGATWPTLRDAAETGSLDASKSPPHTAHRAVLPLSLSSSVESIARRGARASPTLALPAQTRVVDSTPTRTAPPT